MMEAIILELVQKYPFIATALIIVGGLRAVFKPLRTLVSL